MVPSFGFWSVGVVTEEYNAEGVVTDHVYVGLLGMCGVWGWWRWRNHESRVCNVGFSIPSDDGQQWVRVSFASVQL